MGTMDPPAGMPPPPPAPIQIGKKHGRMEPPAGMPTPPPAPIQIGKAPQPSGGDGIEVPKDPCRSQISASAPPKEALPPLAGASSDSHENPAPPTLPTPAPSPAPPRIFTPKPSPGAGAGARPPSSVSTTTPASCTSKASSKAPAGAPGAPQNIQAPNSHGEAQNHQIQVKLPDYAYPGQQLNVPTPDGQTMQITVPPTSSGGDCILMQYVPKAAGAPMQPPQGMPPLPQGQPPAHLSGLDGMLGAKNGQSQPPLGISHHKGAGGPSNPHPPPSSGTTLAHKAPPPGMPLPQQAPPRDTILNQKYPFPTMGPPQPHQSNLPPPAHPTHIIQHMAAPPSSSISTTMDHGPPAVPPMLQGHHHPMHKAVSPAPMGSNDIPSLPPTHKAAPPSSMLPEPPAPMPSPGPPPSSSMLDGVQLAPFPPSRLAPPGAFPPPPSWDLLLFPPPPAAKQENKGAAQGNHLKGQVDGEPLGGAMMPAAAPPPPFWAPPLGPLSDIPVSQNKAPAPTPDQLMAPMIIDLAGVIAKRRNEIKAHQEEQVQELKRKQEEQEKQVEEKKRKEEAERKAEEERKRLEEEKRLKEEREKEKKRIAALPPGLRARLLKRGVIKEIEKEEEKKPPSCPGSPKEGEGSDSEDEPRPPPGPPPPEEVTKPKLPPGWTSAMDGGKVFYWNTVTNSTQWELPTEPAEAGTKIAEASKLGAAFEAKINGGRKYAHEAVVGVTEEDISRLIGKKGATVSMMKNALGGDCQVQFPNKGRGEGPISTAINGKPLYAVKVLSNDPRVVKKGKKVIEIFLGRAKTMEYALSEAGIHQKEKNNPEESAEAEKKDEKANETKEKKAGKGKGKGKDKKRKRDEEDEEVDCMDPSSYSNAPRGKWSKGLEAIRKQIITTD